MKETDITEGLGQCVDAAFKGFFFFFLPMVLKGASEISVFEYSIQDPTETQ